MPTMCDDSATGTPLILVGICSCRANRVKRDAVRETWLSSPVPGIECRFFVGGGAPLADEPDVMAVAAADDYDHLPMKVRAFFAAALALSDFEWLFKCDDDTYVALDRLHTLIDGDHELIGNEMIESRGSPSGGAGYLLSRRMVRILADSHGLPDTGAEDVIVGEAAISHGARALGTTNLCWDRSRGRLTENGIVTSHWCQPEHLRAAHAILHERPDEIEAVHPCWHDRIRLYPSGHLARCSTPCRGRWTEVAGGGLHFDWFDWGTETFFPSGGIYYKISPVPATAHRTGSRLADKTIFVHAVGRMGNQLFQYAYGLHLQLKFGCLLRGNLRLLAGMQGVPEELAHHEPMGPAALLGEVDDDAADRCLNNPLMAGVELRGMFQSYGHSEGIRTHLQAILGPVAKQDAIGVHVRRGDYLRSGHFMNLPVSYYATGVLQIMANHPGDYREIVVFSDDPAWCAGHLIAELGKILPARVYSGGERDTLREMKSMRGMVIANSTFGWWGAWLADCPTVYPRTWPVPGGADQPALGCSLPHWKPCSDGLADTVSVKEHTLNAELLLNGPLSVVDLGACTGEFTDELSRLFPIGAAVLVEAAVTNFDRLRPAPNRLLLNKAVAGRSGIHVPFTEDTDSPYNGSLVFNYFKSPQRHMVETISLQDILGLMNHEGEIDILKVDIEGSEYELLLNARAEDLGRFRQITVEFHDFIDSSLGGLNAAIEQRLRSLGFAVVRRGTNYMKGSEYYDTLFYRPKTASLPEASLPNERIAKLLAGTWDQYNNGVYCCTKTFFEDGRVCYGARWTIGYDGTIRFGEHRVRLKPGGELVGTTVNGVELHYLRSVGQHGTVRGNPEVLHDMVPPEIDRTNPIDLLAHLVENELAAELVRYGPDSDGGYHVPAGIDFNKVFTIGVGDNIGFETDYARSHPDAVFELFDHTVAALPAALPNSTFRRTGVGYGGACKPLPELLEGRISASDTALLKIDCEGGEWNCGLERLRFDGIHTLVLEIHDMLRPADPAQSARVLAAIANNFALLHACPNNCEPSGTRRGQVLTNCIELTLVNKARTTSLVSRVAGPPPWVRNVPGNPAAELRIVKRRERIPTIVSAFFDIGAFQKGAEGIRTGATYRKWLVNFARMENPLVFFAGSEDDIQLMRRIRSGTRHPTKVELVCRHSLLAFSQITRVEELIRNASFPTAHPNTTIAEYSCVQHAKYELIRHALTSDWIDTTHCCWMDCGKIFDVLGLREDCCYQLLNRPELGPGVHYSKVRPCLPRSLGEIQSNNGGDGEYCHAGGFFYGETEAMDKWCALYLTHALRYQSEGYVFNDQATLYAMVTEGLADIVTAHVFPEPWFGLCSHLLRPVRRWNEVTPVS